MAQTKSVRQPNDRRIDKEQPGDDELWPRDLQPRDV
jgi:hypothetical protein